MQETSVHKDPIANRFRSFLPVVVDVETAGFEADLRPAARAVRQGQPGPAGQLSNVDSRLAALQPVRPGAGFAICSFSRLGGIYDLFRNGPRHRYRCPSGGIVGRRANYRCAGLWAGENLSAGEQEALRNDSRIRSLC